MSKTITLRLDEKIYELFRAYAQSDNRSLSNFIETSALRYVLEHEETDEFESKEISSNTALQASLKRAHQDFAADKGRFV